MKRSIQYNYNVVSNDSLLLSNSPAINFIIAVLSVVNDPEDMISRALMLRFFLLANGREEADKVSLISDKLIERFRKLIFLKDTKISLKGSNKCHCLKQLKAS